MFPTAIRNTGLLALALCAGILPSTAAHAGVTQYCLGTTLVEVVRVAEPLDRPLDPMLSVTYRYYYNHPLCRAER
jgi:hypothetical protein